MLLRMAQASVDRNCFASAAALYHYLAMDALALVRTSTSQFAGWDGGPFK